MNEFEIEMQGRIIALEMFLRSLLTEKLCERESPLEAARTYKTNFLASLQNTNRPVDDYADRVWAIAADKIRSQCDQIIQRISQAQKNGTIPPDSEY